MRLCFIAATAALAIGVSGVAHAKPRPARACVRLSQENDPDRRTIVFRIDNSCKQEMTCKISWEITCEPGDEKATTTPFENEGVVAAGMATSWEASAASCAPGDGYAISAPRWACKVPSIDVAKSE